VRSDWQQGERFDPTEVGHADGVKPAFRRIPGKAADRSALNLHLLPPVVNLRVVDASEEEADDATIENFAAPEAHLAGADRSLTLQRSYLTGDAVE